MRVEAGFSRHLSFGLFQQYRRILAAAPAAAFSPFPPVHTTYLERVLRVDSRVWDLGQLRAGDVRIAPSFDTKPATSWHSCANLYSPVIRRGERLVRGVVVRYSDRKAVERGGYKAVVAHKIDLLRQASLAD
jgi:hypothetical protein